MSFRSTQRRASASSAAASVLRRSPELRPTTAPAIPPLTSMNRPAPTSPTRSLVKSSPSPSSVFESHGGGPSSVRLACGEEVHSLLLSSDLSPLEAQTILRAVFRLQEPVVGVFEPARAIVFPFSLVVKAPESFTAECYYLVLERSGVQMPNSAQQSPVATSPEPTPSSSAVSPPTASLLRRTGRQQVQPVRPVQSHAVPQAVRREIAASRPINPAYAKAQHLTRIAAESPVASPVASELEEEEEEEEVDEDTAEEVSSDEFEGDVLLSDSEFERAVDEAMASAQKNLDRQKQKQAQQPTSKQQAQRAPFSQQRMHQQQQQRPAPRASEPVRASVDRAMEERLLRELGDFPETQEERGVESAAASAMRDAFWARAQEANLLQAEREALALSQRKLIEQRAMIDRLREEQARLRARQSEAMARVEAYEKQELEKEQQEAETRRAPTTTATAKPTKVNASTALKKTTQGPYYSTFDSEVDQSDEEVATDVFASESEDEGAYADDDEASSEPLFALTPSERRELEHLQQNAGFTRVAPATLLEIFRARCMPHNAQRPYGRLTRAAFGAGVAAFLQATRLTGESSSKAVLVLNRLFDLFDSNGSVEFAAFATGLSILAVGDRDTKIELAFDAFDSERRGVITSSALERYFTAFFTVLFDLSVHLQHTILRDQQATPAEVARATTKLLCRELLGSTDPWNTLSLTQFKRWLSGPAGPMHL